MSAMSAPTKKYVGAGVVLVRNTTEGPRFLLLRGCDTGVWSFPKGHPEDVDSGIHLNTAIRETREETGYEAGRDYTIISDRFRLGKRPYWIGVLNSRAPWTPHLAAREHSMFGWFAASEIATLNANIDVRAFVKRMQTTAGRCNIPVMSSYSSAIIAS
jgi:8-oxo-dGTP pyrophosphatase MutT (NUDIX family)